MKFFFIYIGCLYAVSIFTTACKFGNNKANKSNLQYSVVEMYCACIRSTPIEKGFVVMSDCSSPARIPPSTFIRPEVLYYTTSDTTIIYALRDIFFKSEYKSDSVHGTDARFVVLLKRNQSSADTLVFINETEFVLNEQFKLSYSMNIMDSIRKIIGKESIQCK